MRTQEFEGRPVHFASTHHQPISLLFDPIIRRKVVSFPSLRFPAHEMGYPYCKTLLISRSHLKRSLVLIKLTPFLLILQKNWNLVSVILAMPGIGLYQLTHKIWFAKFGFVNSVHRM
ncbi:hypothetical protein OPV22_032013 [Ensete ventricosum]|uniref:Uncharacterized protein n=1 Tax=Ensete ventricosum TaxID=4639 RepID=A0AAV8PVE7_ENSVE|nr:hypothetical protein OPV22_032013 [Ensete ventricosum]